MPENGTVAYIDAPKLCDYHKREAENTIRELKLADSTPEAKEIMEAVPVATYDARTRYGYWANMCDPCAADHSMYPGLLGIGRGQRLEVRTV